MIQIKKIELVNIKKHKNFSIDFPNSNLVIIKGKNKLGKTTILDAIRSSLTAKNETKVKVTSGEKEGTIIGTFVDDEGNEAIVKEHCNTDKKSKFTFEYQGLISKNVTDIRMFTKYNDFSVSDFIAWGKTAEGRRKQAKLLLKLLPQEEQDKFYKLIDLEEKLKGERKLINDKIKMNHTLEKEYNISTEDLKLLDNFDEAKDKLNKLKERYDNLNNLFNQLEKFSSSKELFNRFVKDAYKEAEKTLSENVLLEFNYFINTINKAFDDKIKSLHLTRDIQKEKEELSERISKGKDIINHLEEVKINFEKLNKINKELEDLKKKQESYNKNITEVQNEREKILINSTFPIPELRIKNLDEGILINTPEGVFPFDEKQIADSVISIIATKIIYYLNQNTPIVILGKLESFDNDSIENIATFAKENNALLIADKVTDNNEIIVELYFDNNEFENVKENKKEDIKENKKEDIKENDNKINNKKNKEIKDQDSLFNF